MGWPTDEEGVFKPWSLGQFKQYWKRQYGESFEAFHAKMAVFKEETVTKKRRKKS